MVIYELPGERIALFQRLALNGALEERLIGPSFVFLKKHLHKSVFTHGWPQRNQEEVQEDWDGSGGHPEVSAGLAGGI